MTAQRRIRHVLVVGDFSYDMYQAAFSKALRSLGLKVSEFHAAKWFGPTSILFRAQTKYVWGPGVLAARSALMAQVKRDPPDVLFAWRTPWLNPATIQNLRNLGARFIVLYNNDDPYGPDSHFRIHQLYRKCIPYADAVYVYRPVNLNEVYADGARHAGWLPSYFIPEQHHPLPDDDPRLKEFAADVVFVGHYEEDGRHLALEALFRTSLRINIFGTRWDELPPSSPLRSFLPVRPLLGQDYSAAIQAAKVALVFLASRNRDEYTRRCFEIPAIGTAMLAPYTKTLASLYEEDREAVFYRSIEEMVEKALLLCSNNSLRESIARNGHLRCIRSGYDIVSRAKAWLDELESMFF